MSPKQAKERIAKLVETINHHRYLYHVLDTSEISEAALDSLKHELSELEAAFPQFVQADSPSQRVGGEPLPKFEKVKHEIAQWSFNDAFSEAEMREFDNRVARLLDGKHPAYVCELKIDGFKIVLTYKQGVLVRAATRGNGLVGENVTANVRTIESIPLRLRKPVDVIVEGEIWMSKEEFAKLNARQKKEGKELYANPRNVAAGTIRQLDPKMVAERKLASFTYDLPQASFALPKTQEAELELLRELGFRVNKHFRLCRTIDEVILFWKEWQKKKDKEEYWIDGVVVKVNERSLQEQLGYTGKAPRFGIAFKFAAEQVTTVLEDIGIQVGRTGVLTPVAHLRAAHVAGTTVTRATLHNEDEIKRLGLKIGDTVVLEKAGDVIPHVVKVLPELRTGKEKEFRMPKVCPVCKEPVSRDAGLVALRCTNVRCFARERRRLYYFTSKVAFDIAGLGPRILDTLVEQDLITYPADIFDLRKEDISTLDGFGEKSADNLIAAIKDKKEIELARFVIALGIPNVGEETAHDLADHFRSLPKLRAASREDLTAVYGVGETVADSLVAFFEDTQQEKIVDDLLKKVTVQSVADQKGAMSKKLAGTTFVLTGTLAGMSRDVAKQKIRSLGGDVASSVSKATSYLVAGTEPGSKYEKAKELGVATLDEQQFFKLLGV